MVVIIDYNMGNVASVLKAFQKIGAEAIISHQPAEIEKATYLVLPGVGAFGDGMKNLQQCGLVGLLGEKVLKDKTPFLGICLGMQLLADSGTEFGNHTGLGWVRGSVVKLKGDAALRLPHVGWNDVAVEHSSTLFAEVTDPNFYFVHSYHLECADADVTAATCTHGQPFTAALQQDNIMATQFHPEKSQTSGLQVLRNFLAFSLHA